ncbi:alcohol dehydrogenase catalytic domain-containing protein [Saccharopolyspora erythraea]|uniref:zinc-dependent alcohol dehydrogenase n=1 Tax=Saccharopolyspora erythraea TaxID=1836 RepID=UPI001BA7A28E|nr:alcohol dehydrogenase catalytic domain-containing protein [Saccharopolyspora erythraea]QUH03015.1 alcohol dehydrogenase catalytic domain-containing protein [Saccharopolyspora erythraea]
MKALTLTSARHLEQVDDWPDPEPGEHDVVVEMLGVGLCGSDLSVYDGKREPAAMPWIIGHEGCGRIVEVGPAVADRSVGELVVVEPNYCCLHCQWCRRGRTAQCDHRGIVGINRPGLLSQFAAVPARFAWPVPEQWPVERLVCFEPLAVAQGVVRRSGVRAGQSCLVVGAGSQGLLICLSLLAAGVTPAVSEPHPGRLALAVSLGAEPADDPDRRYSYVFESSGVEPGFHDALRAADKTAVVSLVGQNTAPFPVVTQDIVQRQLTLLGALIYDHPVDFDHTRTALGDLDLAPERILRSRATPGRADEALAAAREIPGKSWIDLSDWSA